MKIHIKCYTENCKHSFHATLYCHILPYKSREAPLGMLLPILGATLLSSTGRNSRLILYLSYLRSSIIYFQKKKFLDSDCYIINSLLYWFVLNIPDVYPLNTSSTYPVITTKYLQTLSNTPWRAKSS